jgi:hypothetical protein
MKPEISGIEAEALLFQVLDHITLVRVRLVIKTCCEFDRKDSIYQVIGPIYRSTVCIKRASFVGLFYGVGAP